MPAGRLDITIEQGTTFLRTFTVTEGGTPKNLVGWGIAAQMRGKPTDTSPALTFEAITAASISAGIFQLRAVTADTAELPTYNPPFVYAGFWDCELTSPSGDVTRLLEGNAIVTPGITR